MTYVQAINQVLRRLRENQTSSPTASEYTTHIGALVNEAKREVEDAWDWTALRKTVTISTAASTSQQAIDISVQEAGRDNQRYRILSVYDATNNEYLKTGDRATLRRLINLSAEGIPGVYYIEGSDSNLDPYINLWPVPDGVYSLEVDLLLPQSDLSTGSTNILVPPYPVVLGAFAKALAERGEDNGRSHGEAMQTYMQALGDAITHDSGQVDLGEMTWRTL